MLGYEVNKGILDTKSAQAVLALRDAFDRIETMAKWLTNHPNGGTDPLIESFGYTADEAYAMRIYFETFETVRVNNAATFDIGRKMSGLE